MKTIFKKYAYTKLSDFASIPADEIIYINPSTVKSDINMSSKSSLNSDQLAAVEYLLVVKRKAKSFSSKATNQLSEAV